MTYTGIFIVFEGGDGAGKSTQIERLAQYLVNNGWANQKSKSLPSVVITREPGGTRLGNKIRTLLLDSSSTALEDISSSAELMLYGADRAQHVETVIKPALQQGSIVLCDRYCASTVAYQGYGRGLDLEMIHQINTLATGGLKPDLTLWLDLDPAVGLERLCRRPQDPDPLELEGLEFHHKVREGYATWFLSSALSHDSGTMIKVDASKPEEEVAIDVQKFVTQALERRRAS